MKTWLANNNHCYMDQWSLIQFRRTKCGFLIAMDQLTTRSFCLEMTCANCTWCPSALTHRLPPSPCEELPVAPQVQCWKNYPSREDYALQAGAEMVDVAQWWRANDFSSGFNGWHWQLMFFWQVVADISIFCMLCMKQQGTKVFLCSFAHGWVHLTWNKSCTSRITRAVWQGRWSNFHNFQWWMLDHARLFFKNTKSERRVVVCPVCYW